MASDGSKKTNGTSAIEAQRSKAVFRFREDIAPGLVFEMELKRLLVSTESEYQKIDVLDTYFGRVSSEKTLVYCN